MATIQYYNYTAATCTSPDLYVQQLMEYDLSLRHYLIFPVYKIWQLVFLSITIKFTPLFKLRGIMQVELSSFRAGLPYTTLYWAHMQRCIPVTTAWPHPLSLIHVHHTHTHMYARSHMHMHIHFTSSTIMYTAGCCSTHTENRDCHLQWSYKKE